MTNLEARSLAGRKRSVASAGDGLEARKVSELNMIGDSGQWLQAMRGMSLWHGDMGEPESDVNQLGHWFGLMTPEELRETAVGKNYVDSEGKRVVVKSGEAASDVVHGLQTEKAALAAVAVAKTLADEHSIACVPEALSSVVEQRGRFGLQVKKLAKEMGVNSEEQLKREKILFLTDVGKSVMKWQAVSRRGIKPVKGPKGDYDVKITELPQSKENTAKAILGMMGIKNDIGLVEYIEHNCVGDQTTEAIVREVAAAGGVGRRAARGTSPTSEMARLVAGAVLDNSEVWQIKSPSGEVRLERVVPTKEAMIRGCTVLVPSALGENGTAVMARLVADSARSILTRIGKSERLELGTKPWVKAEIVRAWQNLRGVGYKMDTSDINVRVGEKGEVESVVLVASQAKKALGAVAPVVLGMASLVGAAYVVEQIGQVDAIVAEASDVMVDVTDALHKKDQSMDVNAMKAWNANEALLSTKAIHAGAESGEQVEAEINEYFDQLPDNVKATMTELADSFKDGSEEWKQQAIAELARLGGEFAVNPAGAVELAMSLPILGLVTGEGKKQKIAILALALFMASMTACSGNETAVVPIAVASEASPTAIVIPTPQVVESNSTAVPPPIAEVVPTNEVSITLPGSMTDFDLSASGGSTEQLRAAIDSMSQGDVADMEGWWISKLWREGLLGNAQTYEEAKKAFYNNYDFAYDMTSVSWSVVPQEKNGGRVGYAADANGLPFLSLMPLGVVDLDGFQMKWVEMQPGAVKQHLVHDKQETVYSVIQLDKDGMPMAFLDLRTGQIIKEAVPAAGEIRMGPLPENAADIPEVKAKEGMTVKTILDEAKKIFEQRPWTGKLWARDIVILTAGGQKVVVIVFNIADKDGNYAKADKATEIPIEYMAFMLDQSDLNVFFPNMLPVQEITWGVPLDKLLFIPSVAHLDTLDENGERMNLYWLGFTDGDFAFGNGVPNTFPEMQTCFGPNRTVTAVAKLSNGMSSGDPFNSGLSFGLRLEVVKFTDEKGQMSEMTLMDARVQIAKFIDSPLGENETMPMRVRAIQTMLDQVPVGVGCGDNVAFNMVKTK